FHVVCQLVELHKIVKQQVCSGVCYVRDYMRKSMVLAQSFTCVISKARILLGNLDQFGNGSSATCA
ncbi:hypothetical protein, partial [Planktotalea frisia]|uniref:hypothetical protein n=1 Tax=Planktotalea frisia TaxID=696762 RepID=UPI00235365F7